MGYSPVEAMQKQHPINNVVVGNIRGRAEAVARGVNVVYEDTREEHFLEIVIPD